MAHGPNLAPYLFLQIKFYWNTTAPIYSPTVHGCSLATTAEMSHCQQPMAEGEKKGRREERFLIEVRPALTLNGVSLEQVMMKARKATTANHKICTRSRWCI